MSDDPDNLVLRYLRRIDGWVDRLGTDIAQLRSEMAAMRNDMTLFYHRMTASSFVWTVSRSGST